MNLDCLLPDVAFARSKNDSGEWETVAEHLVRTAELCSGFAGEFGCREVGNALAHLHDLGKYGASFQAVLMHKLENVDHAGPGAAAALSLFGGKDTARLLSTVIAAHHSRLQSSVTGYAALGAL